MGKQSKIWTSFFVTIMALLLSLPEGQDWWPVNSNPFKKISQVVGESWSLSFPLHKILIEGIPLLGVVNGEGNEDVLPGPKEVAVAVFGKVTDIRAGNPESLLKAGIPLLALVSPEIPEIPVPQETVLEEPVVVEPPVVIQPGNVPLVGIYNTHTGETYELTDGTDRLKGKRGGVVTVAAEMEQVLTEKYGIKVVRSETIHDEIFSQSYTKSEETAREMIKNNPSLLMIIDIHRDQVARERTVAKINGEDVAKVILVVGSDATLDHPRWQDNYAFAEKIVATMNRLYPELARGAGIMVKNGRYNQDLHPRAVLMEIGSEKNSTPEAVRSAKLMADVIAEVIRDLEE